MAGASRARRRQGRARGRRFSLSWCFLLRTRSDPFGVRPHQARDNAAGATPGRHSIGALVCLRTDGLPGWFRNATPAAMSKPPFWTPLSGHPRLVRKWETGGDLVSIRMLRGGVRHGRRLGGRSTSMRSRGWCAGTARAHLISTGWRSIVSELFGQYADQRIMQATIDGFAPEVMKKVVGRYNYSDLRQLGDGNTVWVDYVADLGDGFDSTYAMASLISAPQLDIEGAGTLPAAKLLIMGGDQVYPFPTRKAYRERFAMPYTTALPAVVRRQLAPAAVRTARQPRLVRRAELLRLHVLQGALRPRRGEPHRRLAVPAAPQLFRDPAAAQLVDLGRRHPARAVPRCRPGALLRRRRRGDEAASDGSAEAHPVHRRAELELRQGREAAGRGQPQHTSPRSPPMPARASAPSSPAICITTAAT